MSSLHLVSNHLWQSTLFAAAVALAAVALRRKHAGVRYALWLAASIKFVVPFAAFDAIGAAIGSRVAMHVPPPAPGVLTGIADTPFVISTAPGAAAATAAARAMTPYDGVVWSMVLLVIWAAGCALVLAVWTVRFARAWRMVRLATPYEDGREVAILRRVEVSGGPCGRPRLLAVRLSDATIEPGVFGIWRPVLLWPRAMSEHLSDDQIETILVHELSHVRRRDNLTALVHGFVQALCWFHPVVWWIGARLVDERERACDEAVVRAGRDRQTYAESLLKTCQFCVGAPVTCMAGVTGSDLKRRITSIMAAPAGARLGITARTAFALAIAAIVAVPVINGAAGVPQVSSTISLPDPTKTFEAASVRQNTSAETSAGTRSDSDRWTARNLPLKSLLLNAFPIQDAQLIGGPGWLSTDRFDVVAKAATGTSSRDLKVMLQNLLAARFSIKMHIETRSAPIYALVKAKADGQLGPGLHVIPSGGDRQPGGSVKFDGRPGMASSLSMGGATFTSLAWWLSGQLQRPVVDRTGLDGHFDLKLDYVMPGASAAIDSDSAQRAPELFTALQEQLGLKLEATRGPVEVLVIDSAEHPKNDDFEMPGQ
jgi:uncharacterized protein (TIGR03435 family)